MRGQLTADGTVVPGRSGQVGPLNERKGGGRVFLIAMFKYCYCRVCGFLLL